VVFLTAAANLTLAVESMRHGAFDFLAKPFDPVVLAAALRRACEHTALLRDNALLATAVGRWEGSRYIRGDSPAMEELRRKIFLVAGANSTVLVTGETGTGKELVARAIHGFSSRSRKPLVAVNCAAFTETLLESELFGHERGAFTGAERNRQGLFEAAHEGTLFLDEVAEMSLAAQAKLLRVLTDGQIVRLGTTSPRQVNVRVIAATHRDLQQWVRELRFREDLYYRLAVLPLAIPPLRQRREDIPALCGLFFEQVAAELKQPQRRLAPAALERLQAYDFPGNVRELRNLIERACILSSSPEIGAEHFPVTAGAPDHRQPAAAWLDSLPGSIDLRQLLSETEKNLLARALRLSQGSQAEAARRLGLSRSDLAYKLSKHEIKDTVSSN
jgi:DNA-binding NtrC family response regulator